MPNIFGIVLRAHQLHARSTTTLDLVLQAGALAITKKRILALPNQKKLLKKLQAVTNRLSTRIRAKIPAFLLFSASVKTDPRILLAFGNKEKWIRFIITKQNIVRRLQLFDQRLLE